jgi:hypothetical protein
MMMLKPKQSNLRAVKLPSCDSTLCAIVHGKCALVFNRVDSTRCKQCAVLVHACGPVAPLILFHQWWKIATVVKHFKTN